MKQEEKPKQQIGKEKDLILESMERNGIEMTQENYLAIGYPDGINSESEATLPEAFHSLPKE
jgi:hypothetical protein